MQNRNSFWYEEQQQWLYLEQIEGCDFCKDAEDNLWLATNGTCAPVTGLHALQSVLKRKQGVPVHSFQNEGIVQAGQN